MYFKAVREHAYPASARSRVGARHGAVALTSQVLHSTAVLARARPSESPPRAARSRETRGAGRGRSIPLVSAAPHSPLRSPAALRPARPPVRYSLGDPIGLCDSLFFGLPRPPASSLHLTLHVRRPKVRTHEKCSESTVPLSAICSSVGAGNRPTPASCCR